MNRLTITLKQHTPLLHFQPMQEGATLRASEVKPKLDKFLIKTIANTTCYNNRALQNFKANLEHATWFIGNSDALNYKIKIEANGKDESIHLKRKKTGKIEPETHEHLYDTNNYPNNSNSLIMGNMGGKSKNNLLDFIMYDSYIVTIVTKIDALKEVIIKYIKDFFNEHCFGNRSSKGFGSFSVIDIKGYPFQAQKPSYDYLVKLNLTSEENKISKDILYEDVFTLINSIWRTLKKNSGKAPGSETSTLLASTLGNYQHNRVPSILRFKPHLTFVDDEECEVYLAILIDMSITPYTTEFATGVRNYIDKVKKNNKLSPELIDGIKLNYNVKEGSIKLD